MYLSRRARRVLATFTTLVVLVMYFPLGYVARLSVATSRGFGRPRGFSFDAWSRTIDAPGPREALMHSLLVAAEATAVALVLGTLAASALTRFRFFGRHTFNLMIVLPIALPGIVTGIAFHSGYERLGVDLSVLTLVAAHATFCIVVVFNNVAARMRQLGPSLEEASADLGADQLQTWWYVRLPMLRSALLAGGLLSFALSFDEIIVTTFTIDGGFKTLPAWILENMFRSESIPIVNVTATFVVLAMIVPVYVAQRLVDTTPGHG